MLFFVVVCFRGIQELQGGHRKRHEFQTVSNDTKLGQNGAGGGTKEVYRPPRVAPVHYTEETKRGSKKIESERQRSERRKEVCRVFDSICQTEIISIVTMFTR